MKKLWTEYNSQNKKGAKLKVTLCLLVFATTLICSCSGNSKTGPVPNQETKPDAVTPERPSTPSATANTPQSSVFDKLASDMVKVETDTGSFHICRYEVTQKLWHAVTGENPSQMQGDDLPVEQVNRDQCQAFIAKLNELTGKSYRLPTEAEWEFACRGGKESKGYRFSGSNDIDEVAWYDSNSEGKTHPVGQKMPNELGLYDMSGNVWEWCQNMNESTGMCRGGSWIHNARNCDPSLPNETPRGFWINCLGLRLAL